MSKDQTPVPLGVARNVAEELRQLLEPACQRIEIAGSIRRLRPYVHDIELVAIPQVEAVAGEPGLFGSTAPAEPYNLLWKALDGFLEGRTRQAYIRKGDKLRSFRWPIHERDRAGIPESVQVDLFTTSEAGWGWIYLVRTGSATYSKQVATCLKAKGFIGHEGRIYHRVADKPRGDAIGTPTEEDVFRLADLKPVAPAERSWG